LAKEKTSYSPVSAEDIERTLTEFQDTNGCIISIETRVGVMGGKRSLEMTAHAWNNHTGDTGRPLLASASVRCSALRLATLEAAILNLLYALDSQLAWGEFGSEQKT